MKKITKVIACALLLVGMMATTVLAKTGTVTGETVRIREKADKSSGVVINLHKGDKVEILSENGDWYEVKTKRHKGYMHKDYVQIDGEEAQVENTEKPEETTPEVPEEPVQTPENTVDENTTEENNQATDSTEIIEPETPAKESLVGKEIILKNDVQTYLLPSVISIKTRIIAKEQKVIVVDEINGWIKVSNANSYDWIYTKSMDVESIPETPAPEVPDTTPEEPTTSETNSVSFKTGYINVNRANIRESNSTDAKILGRLTLNTVVEVIEQKDNWYKIKTDKIEGYVSSDLVSKGKPVTSRSPEEDRVTEVPSDVNNSLNQALGGANKEPEKPVETPAPPVTNTPVASNESGVVEYAKQFLGFKYVSGGKNPNTGFDCSGFTSYVYKHFGVTIAASSASQINYGTPVEKANMQPGDLILYLNDGKTKIGHCGIYIGGGKFIHAANPKRGVVIDNVDNSYYGPRFVAARRIVN